MPLRRLAPQDAEAFRELRLEALRLAPAAFGASWEEEASKPLSWFGVALDRSDVFAAEDSDGSLLGMLAYQGDGMLKRRHIGHLWGMYVRAAARGQGLGAALLEVCIAHARERVAVLQLMVGEGNAAARRRYEHAGFTVYGTELASLRANGVDTTTLLMALHFE